MEENCFWCKLSEMMSYVRTYSEKGDALDWVEILKLKERPVRITYIGVVDDHYPEIVVGSAAWWYRPKGDKLKFDRIQVEKNWRNKYIGTTIMAMVIAIARFYKVQRITGTIVGEKFLWYWYAKLGFTIYDRNKLLMEFEYP
jgi:N-acetylglutamate synthase-like GNAT family acetyltransferase